MAEGPWSCDTDLRNRRSGAARATQRLPGAHVIRSTSRLILVLIVAAAIALSAGGFSWDGTPDNVGSGVPDTAVVDGPSVDSAGIVTGDGFSWDDGSANPAAVGG